MMDRHRFVIMELASNGYGSPEVLMNERADLIMDAYDYMRFKAKFEYQTIMMRREKCS